MNYDIDELIQFKESFKSVSYSVPTIYFIYNYICFI